MQKRHKGSNLRKKKKKIRMFRLYEAFLKGQTRKISDATCCLKDLLPNKDPSRQKEESSFSKPFLIHVLSPVSFISLTNK